MKKVNKKLILANIALVTLFFISQILVMSILGTKTQEIDIIRSEKEELRLENEILTSEIDKAKSVTSSQEVKDRYGLVEKNVTFLDVNEFDDLALND